VCNSAPEKSGAFFLLSAGCWVPQGIQHYFSDVSVRLIPLFPLPLVLFPRAPLPLHIFEPRYRRMLTDCMSRDRQFGIICREEGVAELEIPTGTVGCVAQIETTQQLPDGRSNILVQGGDRFTLERFVVDAAPYHVAQVATIADHSESSTLLAPLADRLRELFERVGRSARTIADDVAPLPDLPDDPAYVSFAIAQYIDLDLAVKQRLLTSLSPSGRLRDLTDLLSTIVSNVELRAATHVRARSNGHGPVAGAP
jgi:ATP-dependent Lon protease